MEKVCFFILKSEELADGKEKVCVKNNANVVISLCRSVTKKEDFSNTFYNLINVYCVIPMLRFRMGDSYEKIRQNSDIRKYYGVIVCGILFLSFAQNTNDRCDRQGCPRPRNCGTYNKEYRR